MPTICYLAYFSIFRAFPFPAQPCRTVRGTSRDLCELLTTPLGERIKKKRVNLVFRCRPAPRGPCAKYSASCMCGTVLSFPGAYRLGKPKELEASRRRRIA
ncbi:hypothetical protein MRX96_055073 [Rhipicephalus microplus]